MVQRRISIGIILNACFIILKISSGNVQTVVSGNSYNFIKKESIISLKGNVHITLGAFTYMV